MDLIAKIFSTFTYVTWWIAGLIMIAGETFVSGSFLLWLGVAAFFVGILMFVGIVLSWSLQLTIFAVSSVVFIVIWRKFARKKPNNLLSHRAKKYIGKTFTVVEPIENGVGKIKIEDTVWRALCDDDIKVGEKVKIISVSGASFSIIPNKIK